MSVTTPLQPSDNGADSRVIINGNFTAMEDAMDVLVVAGSPLATDSVKGRVKLSVTPVDPAEPTAVGDNDARLPTTDQSTFLAGVTGMIFPYGGASAPTGFLVCDGSAVSRATYATLYAVTGDSYGAGDGSTTFNVPDLKGRFPLGYSASAPTKVLTLASRSSNVITVTGADNHAHNEIQTGQAVLYSAPSGAMTGLTHNTTYYLVRVSATTFSLATSVASANAGAVIALSSDGTGTQTFTLTYTARPLGQKGGEETHALTDAEMPSHIHSLGFSTGAGGTVSTAMTSFNSTAISTGNAGSDVPHNIMPLFTVVNYIIKT